MLPVFQAYSSRATSHSIPAGTGFRLKQALQPQPDPDESFDDYINASWIDSCLKKQLLIAAMAPKENTVTDFLHMLMEHNVKLVLKVCQDKYNTSEQCFRYIGKEVCGKKNCSDAHITSTAFFETVFGEKLIKYTVEVLSSKQKFSGGITVRKVRIIRRVFRKNTFFGEASLQGGGSKTQDDVDAIKVDDFFSCTEESKGGCSSTSKAELAQ